MLCSICDLRRKHNNLQGPDKRRVDLASGHLHHAGNRSRRAVLAFIVVPTERESREEGLYKNICSLNALILYLPDNLPCRNSLHNSDGLFHTDLPFTDLHHDHRSHRSERADKFTEGRRCRHKFCRHHISDNQQGR